MKNIIYILGFCMFLAIGCSHKSAPFNSSSPYTTKIPCDSIIQALIDSVKSITPVSEESDFEDLFTETEITEPKSENIDTSGICNYYKLSALEMAKRMHSLSMRLVIAEKETEYFKALAQSRAKKIINNINSGNKNTQIGDANVQQQKTKGPAVVGDGNVTPIKPKQSAIGDGNKMDNSSKDRFWLGFLVASGVIFGIYFSWQAAKNYIPGFLPVRFLSGIISKIKFIS